MTNKLTLHHVVPSHDSNVTKAHWQEAVRSTFASRLQVGRDGMSIPVAA